MERATRLAASCPTDIHPIHRFDKSVHWLGKSENIWFDTMLIQKNVIYLVDDFWVIETRLTKSLTMNL